MEPPPIEEYEEKSLSKEISQQISFSKEKINLAVKNLLNKYIPELPEYFIKKMLEYDWTLVFTVKSEGSLQHNYETLEILGDKVLGSAVILFVMENMIPTINYDYANYIHQISSSLINNHHLSLISIALKFDELAISPTASVNRNNLADMIEAFIGAIQFYGNQINYSEDVERCGIRGFDLVQIFVKNLMIDMYQLSLNIDTYIDPRDILDGVKVKIFPHSATELRKEGNRYYYILFPKGKEKIILDLKPDELKNTKYVYNNKEEAEISAAIRAIGILARDYKSPEAQKWMKESNYDINNVNTWYYSDFQIFNEETRNFLEQAIKKRSLCSLFPKVC